MLSLSYPPNIGGVETHLHDFVKYLSKVRWPALLLTFHPITTRAFAKSYERLGSVEVRRIHWFGKTLFYKLKDRPALEFIYLFIPLLLFGLYYLIKYRDIKIIHAHGLIAGFVAVVVGKTFGKKIIISTHSIYHFPKRGLYRNFSYFIFSNAHQVLTLSKQSKAELELLGIKNKNIHVFTYWVDQEIFKPTDKNKAKAKLNLDNQFIVLFVGRLIEEKGVMEMLKSTRLAKGNIYWAVAGEGPLAGKIKEEARKNEQIIYCGGVRNEELPDIYNASDLLLVPSIHEEGFGRVILEALSCGVPVIASNRGGIKEAMSNKVGALINITPQQILESVEEFKNNRKILIEKSKCSLEFAKKRYSERNVQAIISLYE